MLSSSQQSEAIGNEARYAWNRPTVPDERVPLIRFHTPQPAEYNGERIRPSASTWESSRYGRTWVRYGDADS